MSLARLATLYALFGVIATASNLGAQAVVHEVLELHAGKLGWVYWLALGFGTGVGLVIKYVLDKRWIFFDRSTGAAAHGKRFALYTTMGLATTVIFWGMQTSFFLIWDTESMLYLGGGLGLAIGYVVKYHLDKMYVFTPSEGEPPNE